MTRTLITGGCGFIGRHVADELSRAGHDVVAYDSMIDQVHGETKRREADARLVRADVRDRQALAEALRDVENVVHLAAEVGVGQSMYEIARYTEANDLGTAVLLEEIGRSDVRRVVVASSMSVYGEGYYRDGAGARHGAARRRPQDLRQGHWEVRGADGAPMTPEPTDEAKTVDLASIYALTKYAQERAVLIFGDAYGVDAVALRLFNVFGAGQALSNPYTGVLANFAARLASGARPMVFEDGAQKRDFVHVRDVARAFRLALESDGAVGETINIGSGHAYAIAEVAQMLAEAMGVPDLTPEIVGKYRAGDIRNCFADISKARALLGFEPEHRLEASLDPFVEWVRTTPAVDRGAEMRRALEDRGLVA